MTTTKTTIPTYQDYEEKQVLLGKVYNLIETILDLDYGIEISFNSERDLFTSLYDLGIDTDMLTEINRASIDLLGIKLPLHKLPFTLASFPLMKLKYFIENDYEEVPANDDRLR